MALTLDPVVGSLIGALLGVSDIPGPWTLAGGSIIVRALSMYMYKCIHVACQHSHQHTHSSVSIHIVQFTPHCRLWR